MKLLFSLLLGMSFLFWTSNSPEKHLAYSLPSETHDFVTYDTLIVYHYDAFHSFNYYLRISRPRNLFTAGNADTASRPAFIMMPGQGEMNSDSNSLTTWGPHYWLNNGWDGSVVLGNGTHYPILITMTCDINPPQPPVAGNLWILNYLVSHYHIKPRGVHLTGLSEGSFTWSGMLGLTDTTGTGMTGNDVGCRLVTSMCLLSGAATSTGTWSVFGHWAKQYGGKAFLTVGYADAQVQNPPLLAMGMNDSVNGSAYFTYNTIAGGTHNQWNTDYDPTLHSWQSFSPYGTYVTTNTDSNSRGTYQQGQSIFQWMYAQGDTSMVGQSTPTPLSIKKVICMEYWAMFHASNDTAYALYGNGVQAFPLPNGERLVNEAGCFNLVRAVSSAGKVYQSIQYNNTDSTNWTPIPNDSSGAAITNAIGVVDGYADNFVFGRADSSLWYMGTDDADIFHSTGSVFMRPYKMTTTAAKFKEAVICARGVYALTSDGTQLYYWGPGSGTSPTITSLAGKGTGIGLQVSASGYNSSTAVTYVIIQQTPGSAYGHPYVLGTSWGLMGLPSSASYGTLTDLYSIWGLTSPVKEINVNTQRTALIDSVGDMFAGGFNTQGEVGVGWEAMNQYTNSSFPSFSWNFVLGNDPVVFSQIGIGVKWSHLYSNDFFTFYTYASDIFGNYFSWGRNKTDVLGNGYLMNDADNQNHPNALDTSAPALVTPLTQTLQKLNFVAPAPSAGSDQIVNGSSTNLTAGGHPAVLVLTSNTADTVLGRWVSYQWSQKSGAPATIVSPNAQTTAVTGLSAGTYHFQVLETDNKGGTDTAGVTLTGTASGTPSPARQYMIFHRYRSKTIL